MTNNPRGDELKEILAKIIKDYGGTLERLAESERIDRERFEQGLDSKYGWPEDDEDGKED